MFTELRRQLSARECLKAFLFAASSRYLDNLMQHNYVPDTENAVGRKEDTEIRRA